MLAGAVRRRHTGSHDGSVARGCRPHSAGCFAHNHACFCAIGRAQVFNLTSLAAVPLTANPSLLAGAPEFEFTAHYTRHCQQVSFNSGLPAYFIAVTA